MLCYEFVAPLLVSLCIVKVPSPNDNVESVAVAQMCAEACEGRHVRVASMAGETCIFKGNMLLL